MAEGEKEVKEEKKKKFYEEWWFWLLVGLVLLGLRKPAEAKEGEAQAEIKGLAFEASPQAERISKKPGESATAIVTVANTGTVPWSGVVTVRFGEVAVLPPWTTDPTMPVLTSPSASVAPGATYAYRIPFTVPTTAKAKTYDVEVALDFDGRHIERRFLDVFTVVAVVVGAEIRSLVWL